MKELLPPEEEAVGLPNPDKEPEPLPQAPGGKRRCEVRRLEPGTEDQAGIALERRHPSCVPAALGTEGDRSFARWAFNRSQHRVPPAAHTGRSRSFSPQLLDPVDELADLFRWEGGGRDVADGPLDALPGDQQL